MDCQSAWLMTATFSCPSWLSLGSYGPAKFGSGLESSKEIAIDPRRADAFRRALRGQTEDGLTEGGHVLKGTTVALRS